MDGFLQRFDPNWDHSRFFGQWKFLLRGQESGNIKWKLYINKKTSLLCHQGRQDQLFEYRLVSIDDMTYTFNRVKHNKWFWDISSQKLVITFKNNTTVVTAQLNSEISWLRFNYESYYLEEVERPSCKNI